MPIPTISQKFGQTPTHVATYVNQPSKDNDNGAFESIYLSNYSNHFSGFDITNDFYNFVREDEDDNDDIGLYLDYINPPLSQFYNDNTLWRDQYILDPTIAPMLPAISTPFQLISKPI